MARLFTLLMLGLLTLVLLIRALSFAEVVREHIGSTLDVYFLESQMVHLAQRAQYHESIYPDWRKSPHVANVFGPVYFEVVGFLGRQFSCDSHDLRLLGRAVSIISVLCSSVLVGWILRQYGVFSALCGTLASLGTPILFGFGYMTRSDSLAELLGFTGFCLAISSQRWVGFSALLLALATLTRQPAGLFLIAGLLVLLVSRRRFRAMELTLYFLGLTGLAVVVYSLFKEPRLFEGLFLEAQSPFSVDQLVLVGRKFLKRGWDLVGFTVCLFAWSKARDPFSTLGVLALVTGLVLSAKEGSDVNYYLPVRLPAGVCLGILVSELMKKPKTILGALAALVFTLISAFQLPFWISEISRRFDLDRQIKYGVLLRNVDAAIRLTKESHVLTDVDEIALAQGKSAAFVDPFLFRLLVQNGRLEPSDIIQKVKRRHYDYVITRVDLFDPMYDRMGFGFPKCVADVIKENYELWQSSAFRFYRPRAHQPSDLRRQ